MDEVTCQCRLKHRQHYDTHTYTSAPLCSIVQHIVCTLPVQMQTSLKSPKHHASAHKSGLFNGSEPIERMCWEYKLLIPGDRSLLI